MALNSINWLQKLCSRRVPIHYIDIAHNVSSPVIVWAYNESEGIIDAEVDPIVGHISDKILYNNVIASGRIDPYKQIGSFVFNSNQRIDANKSLYMTTLKRVINDIVNKYPGIKFYAFPILSAGMNLQEYYEQEVGE